MKAVCVCVCVCVCVYIYARAHTHTLSLSIINLGTICRLSASHLGHFAPEESIRETTEYKASRATEPIWTFYTTENPLLLPGIEIRHVGCPLVAYSLK